MSKFFFPLLIAVVLGACHAPPELPHQPEIGFLSVKYWETDSRRDSLNLVLAFQDGNGDLGLAPIDTVPPYNRRDFVLGANGQPITYANRRPEDPIFTTKNNGIKWEIRTSESETDFQADTLRIELNPNHYNYFVRWYHKDAGVEGAQYEEYNFLEVTGVPLDGRFPILNTTDRERPLQGELKYGIVSSGIRQFSKDSIRLELWIQDRALNESNHVFTPSFTLNDIKASN
ncbi:hypothetical protein [Persicobacter psychrovividus]|uniref:Lipoprotein n=1 Tax=Persicobacter psychrovividus TaxID=387638 RepID=A0ABN6L5C0_9BACT|nr:hypothetical protein PEPS_06000 [Persicobacter psychrovividus]